MACRANNRNFFTTLGKDGDLARGNYRVTLQEMLRHLGMGSWQRVAVARRLERIYRVALATGQVTRFVVFGSFVTAKRDPADVDVFLLTEDKFDMGRLTGETRVLFDHAAAQAHFGASGLLSLGVRRPMKLQLSMNCGRRTLSDNALSFIRDCIRQGVPGGQILSELAIGALMASGPQLTSVK